MCFIRGGLRGTEAGAPACSGKDSDVGVGAGQTCLFLLLPMGSWLSPIIFLSSFFLFPANIYCIHYKVWRI